MIKTRVRMDAVTRFFDDDMNTAKGMRLDLNPAWDHSSYTRVAINGLLDGTQRVVVADLSGLISRQKKWGEMGLPPRKSRRSIWW